MTLEGLLNERGPLNKLFFEFDSKTIQHAFEITNDRRTLENESEREGLRDRYFWTADSSMYRIENGKAILYFGDVTTNLVFNNATEAFQQLIQTNNYVPSSKDIQTIIKKAKSGDILRIKLSELNLKGSCIERLYFEIDTANYGGLNGTQRKLAEKIYGQEEDFEKNMKMLKDANIRTTQISVLNPEYIETYVEKDSAIVRTTKICSFRVRSEFYANEYLVENRSNVLRGVPRMTEHDKKKISEFYELLKKKPCAQKIAADMLNIEIAAELSKVFTLYLENAHEK